MAVAASLMTPGDATATPDAPPILLAVAKCESGQRQYAPDGTVLESKTHDVGYLQLNLKTWDKKAKSLGWDIQTPQGNIAMGLWIYHHVGLSAWKASSHCWKGKSDKSVILS